MKSLNKQLLSFCSLIFIFSLWTFLVPDTFLSIQNQFNVLSRSASIGIIAVAMTFVIITAGIDLSVGSILALTGMIGAFTMLKLSGGTLAQIASGDFIPMTLTPMIIGTIVAMLAGALMGFINGTLITKLEIAPFIVTLGTMSIYRGIAYVMNDSRTYSVTNYTYLDAGSLFGIPVTIYILFIFFALGGFLLKYTKLGRYTYAIGSNPETAFQAGINVKLILVSIYTLLGTLTGLAGMIFAARASSAQPSAGISLELDVIAAVIIGGTSPNGGKGTMQGTLIGTLLIGYLRNGLTLLNVSSNLQLIVIGLIIVFAVASDRYVKRKAEN